MSKEDNKIIQEDKKRNFISKFFICIFFVTIIPLSLYAIGVIILQMNGYRIVEQPKYIKISWEAIQTVIEIISGIMI